MDRAARRVEGKHGNNYLFSFHLVKCAEENAKPALYMELLYTSFLSPCTCIGLYLPSLLSAVDPHHCDIISKF
jgi:hypothetical protein